MSSNHVVKYACALKEALNLVDPISIQAMQSEIEHCMKHNLKILVCGNGGSAALAEHLSCDYNKGVASDTCFKPTVVCLNSNVSLTSAIANDIGYDQVFAKQVEWFNDHMACLIIISSSGSSPNVVNALKKAQEIGMYTVALVGFDGGTILKEKLANVIVHVPWYNYGIVEDAHSVIMHSVAQEIRKANAVPGAVLKL